METADSQLSHLPVRRKMAFVPIKDGEFTSTIYGLIKEEKYSDAIRVLQYELQRSPQNRAALSLLGYCYYYIQDFQGAIECYEQLSTLFPAFSEYKLFLAQALYQAFMIPDALAVVASIDDPNLLGEVVKLESAIKYREEDLNNARVLVEQYPPDDSDMEVNLACIEYKEGNYEEALSRFTRASNFMGYQPQLAYCIALCYYSKKEYSQALGYIANIIDRGVKDHPELGVGISGDSGGLRTVGNTMLLHETSLVEAFNLKFAIEYKLKEMSSANESLADMPPRLEEELDAVTLHNQALLGIEANPTDGFAKLQYLLSQNPFPPETFANLLLLYCKYEYFDLAADVLAENAHLTYKYLTQYLFEYLDAVINQQTSPEDALAKFDSLANQQMIELRKLTKQVKEIRQTNDDQLAKKAIQAFDETLELYLPVLMSQAKIFWDKQMYAKVEEMFRVSAEFCGEHDTWKLNVAHTLFMQGPTTVGTDDLADDEKKKDTKFAKAADFYEPIISKQFESVITVPAIIVANLCVCYIMNSNNQEAEELMRKVEREEEDLIMEDPNRKVFHMCIINLVIGTLYCSKNNYEFGVSRVIKAMEPQNRRLGTDTWYYAKRCLLAVIEALSKHLIVIRDSIIEDIDKFLVQCEMHGRDVPVVVDGPLTEGNVDTIKNTVTYESRQLRALLHEVIGW